MADLVAAARTRKLALDREWLRLVHYRPRLLGGFESDADGPAFFLAPGGKTDPEAELEATLSGFFAPAPADPKAQHPQCQFPARRAWLTERLGLDPARLPSRPCPGFEAFSSRVQARGVTLVFSSYYLNNPASAFGHTFLRLDKAESAKDGRRFELVDYGIDFAATVDTENAIVYAVKGLTGMFHGEFSHYPYFYKVRQYADYESRDLWEYDLDLTPRETAMLVAHLWELGSTWFDYYYLTENCSHGILAALEAAAARLDLLSHVGWVVIPADTVKALFRNPGLVRAVHFRPSIRTQFQRRVAELDPRELDAVEALTARPAAPLEHPLAPASEARALDAALDYVDFVHAHELIDNVVTPAAETKQRLMERRAGLGVQSPEMPVPAPLSQQPQLGHGSIRAGAGGGASSLEGPLLVLDFRLALHDLADPPAGYPSLAQIEFLPVRLRYAPRSSSLALEEALLVDVVSLNDFNRFEQRISWKARIGTTTIRDGGCPGCVAGVVEAGGGLAKALLGSRLTAFATTDAQLLGAAGLQGAGGARLRVGLGPSGGLRIGVGERLSLVGEGSWRWLPFAEPGATFGLKLTARVHLGPVSLSLEAARWPLESMALGEVLLYL